MKYILLLTLTWLTLSAQIDEKQMYAKVTSTNADLYQKPYECSKKKENFFKKGDMVEVLYCDKYQWCKTKNGFVKKNLLRLPEPLVKQDKKMPIALVKPKKAVMIENPITVVQLQEPEVIQEVPAKLIKTGVNEYLSKTIETLDLLPNLLKRYLS